ncbi:MULTISPECIES: PAAR-like protein [unclassified Chryseobacterium]|uniref:DUF4280 and LysM peptidoglycan-binding domain-containing protein n=1 Tax=unclassified Chryseobacterium TaxID=2593645 RepID=UPI00226AF320|nr:MULTISPECIES: PAAR-like protein [unclassified Chryseobacterium]
MKKGFIYIVKKGETLESIADDYGISVYQLRKFHNLWCEDINDGIAYKVWEGKKLTVEREMPSKEEIDARKEEEYQQEKEKKEVQKQKEEETQRIEHENKFYVVDGAKCVCDKGAVPATLKVTSHSKTIFSSRNNDEKFVGTLEDVQFKEGNSCFGSCTAKNNNPCAFVPAGKWKKPYEKMKIVNKQALLEISYLMCSVGGKITVQHHGQSVIMGSNNVQKADAELMNQVMPGINFEEFQGEYDENQYYL